MMLLILLSACGYRTCGTLEYWTYAVDPQFDDNADQYLDLIEACKADYGSFASDFPDVGLSSLLVSNSEWDMTDAVDVTYDYLPTTEIVFRTDHLVVGEVMTMAHLAGYGFHIPEGVSWGAVQSWGLYDGTIEVLDGPKEGSVDGVDFKIRFELVIGAPDDQAPRGYQVHQGEDWVNFSPSLWAWDAAGHNGLAPPDWTPPS